MISPSRSSVTSLSTSPGLPRGLRRRVGYLLNRPALLIRERAQNLLKAFGLIPPHFAVMATLESEGPLTQRALGKLLRVDPTTMVWIIDHLEKGGFVRRGKHPQDRRAYLVELSASGKSTYERASKQLDQLDEEFLAPLSKTEREDLRRLLTKLFQNVTTQTVSPHLFERRAKS
jgi:DNA-binding MarR family transcriptional regulator